MWRIIQNNCTSSNPWIGETHEKETAANNWFVRLMGFVCLMDFLCYHFCLSFMWELIMIDMTKEQREALMKVYERKTDKPLTHEKFVACADFDCMGRGLEQRPYEIICVEEGRISCTHAKYLIVETTLDEFIATAYPGPGCIMVPWLDMQLGIEKDGHTHS